MADLNELQWLPVKRFPGYEISSAGPVCQIRRDGSRKVLMPYSESRYGIKFVTLWKNNTFHKVAIRKLMEETWVPLLKENKLQKKTTVVRYQEMVDGFDPSKISATAYMKYLRGQGRRFANHILYRELSQKKKRLEESLV